MTAKLDFLIFGPPEPPAQYNMENKYPTLMYERSLWDIGYTHIAGIDEAGRGAWAGPVCAAALILPPNPAIIDTLDQVRDSKLMSAYARETWAPIIRKAAQAWGIGFATSQEIDRLGILPATKLAATRAMAALCSSTYAPPGHSSAASPLLALTTQSPDYLLTDYLVFPELEWNQTALIKGDRLSLSVAGASVLAKTARDEFMRAMDRRYPGYAFARHKGYGTRIHTQAIRELGLCEIHRKSFAIPR